MQEKIKFNTVIFDMDGTLLDTLEDIADSVNYTLEKLGFPPRDLSEIRSYIGNGVTYLMELSIPEGRQNPEFNHAISLFRQHYSCNCTSKTRPYTGIVELLRVLANRGYKTAVISNKFDEAVKKLNDFYFSRYIAVAIGEKDDIRKKPAADMLLSALNRLGSTVEEAVYIGDSEVDIETARNAGIDCISVTWGFRDRDWLVNHGAATIVDSPEELLRWLQGSSS